MSIRLDSLITISYTTIGGAIIGGPIGGLVGFSTAVIDEILINNESVNKHYLSLSSFWYLSSFKPLATLVTKFIPNSNIVKFTSYGFSILFSYYADDFLDFKYKLDMPLNSFNLSNKLFDKENIASSTEITKIYNLFLESPKDALSLIQEDYKKLGSNDFIKSFIKITGASCASIMLDYFFIKSFAKYSAGLFLTNLFKENKGSEILLSGSKIISYFLLKDIVDTFFSSYQNSLNRVQFNLIIEKSNNLILENGNGRKIAASENGKELNTKMIYDLYMISYVGVQTLNKVFYEAIQSLFSFALITKEVPLLFGAYSIFHFAKVIFLESLFESSKENNIKKTFNEETIWDYIIDIRDNIDQLNLRDGGPFMAHKSNILELEKNNLYQDGLFISKLKSLVELLTSRINDFIDLIFVYKECVNLDKFAFVKSQINIFSAFLLSNIKAKTDSISIDISLDRMKKRYDEIEKKYNPDRLETSNLINKIIFHNYSLKLDSKELLHIEDLSFELGKTYAITGASGCGKTSMLIDLKAEVFGALSSSGEISLPIINGKKAKIMFVDQNVYMPKGSSLLETIFFPNVLALRSLEEQKEIRDKVIELFLLLKIDGFVEDGDSTGLISSLDSRSFKLSGGQAKKIAIIQAIVNKADIYILDETFTGLDKESLMNVQFILKSMIENATFLIVDHHAQDNNYNNFYDSEVHFTNGSAFEREIFSITEEFTPYFPSDSIQSFKEEVCLPILGLV